MEKNLKNIRKKFKEQGVFYSSGEMAETQIGRWMNAKGWKNISGL